MPPPGSNKPGHANVAKTGPGNVVKVKFSEAKKVKVVQEERDIFQELLVKEREISPWSAIFLPTLAVVLLALGITCIVMGGVVEIPDLIVLGVMFLIGAVIFGFMMFVVVCRPYCSRNQVYTYDDEKDTTQLNQPNSNLQNADYFYGVDPDEDLVDARNRPGPTENELYGRRSIPQTPATATDVNLEPESDTPPPPQVALPSNPGKISPVYTIDVDDASRKTKEMKDLELL